jgi:hypothetical protein
LARSWLTKPEGIVDDPLSEYVAVDFDRYRLPKETLRTFSNEEWEGHE